MLVGLLIKSKGQRHNRSDNGRSESMRASLEDFKPSSTAMDADWRPLEIDRRPIHPLDMRLAISQLCVWDVFPRACQLFSATPQMNPQCCGQNDILKTLSNGGQLEKALEMLSQMETVISSPDAYFCLLRECQKRKALMQTKQVHTHLIQSSWQHCGYLNDYLVMTLAKCGAITDALQLAQKLPSRTVYSWTALISAYNECGQGREALKLYTLMQDDGVKPNHYTFVSLLKACASIGDLEKGRKLHGEARRMGFGVDTILCTTLINMYGKCGAIVEAEDVFSALIQRDVVAWNAMLTAYVEQGLSDKAFQLYRQMHEEMVILDQSVFVIAIQACCSFSELCESKLNKDVSLEIGRALHADAKREGFVSGSFIVSTLVNMYHKCGAMKDAEHIFSAAHQQLNSVTWNVMISSYFYLNQEEISLQLYQQMHEEGTSADQYTFTIVLQVCGALADREEGIVVDGQKTKVISLEMVKALHADAQRLNFASDIFISNTLIRIYGKCGSIFDAEAVFCKLSDRDIISWNSLFSAYVEHEQKEKALCLYVTLQQEGVIPDQVAFVMTFQACGQLADKEEVTLTDEGPIKARALEIGQGLHFDAQESFSSDIVVGDALIRMYGRCGAIFCAEEVFEALCDQHDVRSWTAMLSAYVEQDIGAKALQLYCQMLKKGVLPDQHTFVVVLYACGTLAEKDQTMGVIALEIGLAIHADFMRTGFASNIFINNTLVSMYGKCGAIGYAENVFAGMVIRDEVSWNAMLSAHIDKEEKVLQLFRQMQSESFSPNELTYVIALQACCFLSDKNVMNEKENYRRMSYEIGQAIHADVKRSSHTSSTSLNNILLTMYGKCGTLHEAEDVFLMMSQNDPVSWTAMLSVFIEQGHEGKALELYKQMQKQGSPQDEVTLMCMLQVCSEISSLEICKQQHFVIVAFGCELNLAFSASLIHAYGSCACMKDAGASLDGLHVPSIPSWNSCIASFAEERDCLESLLRFEQMQYMGAEPDEVTFISVLRACSHAGRAIEGSQYFIYMVRDCGLYADLKHYGILVDLLGRTGNIKRAEGIIGKMPMQADHAMWLCLLGACRIHGSIEAGVRAFNRAVVLQPGQSATYVLMSNIYAELTL